MKGATKKGAFIRWYPYEKYLVYFYKFLKEEITKISKSFL